MIMYVTTKSMETVIPEDLLAPFTQDAIDVILEDVADAARDYWRSEAMRELHSSQIDYVNGIQRVEMSPGQASISLVGVLPNLVEQGMDETDMRDTLLGPNVPLSEEGEFGKHLTIRADGKVGYYRAIPFRHGTPTSKVSSISTPMPKDVYSAAKKLRSRMSDPYKGDYWQEGEEEEGKEKRLGSEYGSKYTGMIKTKKAYQAYENTPEGPKGRGVQSQYMTFRTISTLQTEGWIRPATPGKFISNRVAEFAEKTMIDALMSFAETP